MQACVEGRAIATRSCIIAVQRLGGWEVDETTNDGHCYQMLQTLQTGRTQSKSTPKPPKIIHPGKQ